MSVGEWLNSVIARNDEEVFTNNERLAERVRNVSRHGGDRVDSEAPVRPRGSPYRDESRDEAERGSPHGEVFPPRKPEREGEREAPRRDVAALSRDEPGDVHARLDRLSQQIERLNERSDTRPTGAPPRPLRNAAEPSLSIDDAVAEITARQRALDGEAAAPDTAHAPAPDFSGLERQLREIMTRIEALQPAADIEKAIATIRTDLADIGRQINEALPRRAVESLEIEVKALAERIDHSRQSGVDQTALAGLERGLGEVREALRGLMPAESLVGFDQAVNALAQKVDRILAKDDPAALQELEATIGGLHGVVSHVASNDTLARVAEDVRALAAQVDSIANNAASGQAVLALERRIDTLAAALNASSEAGHAVPRDLEKLLAGLIEKLEWVQLTHTDHAAMAHLEDRIATLVKRLEASDAWLGHLEAIERGLADLLVHIEQMRSDNGGAAPATRLAPAPRSFEHDVAEIKQSDRRTQDSLEAVHDTVEHVVDRLATIESGLHRDAAPPAADAALFEPASEWPELEATPQSPLAPADAEPQAFAAAAPPEPAAARPVLPTASRALATRLPIDPTLPPNHPLEPGLGAVRSRPMPSAADRVAASEAAIGSAKPPVIADSGRPDFIAAARRAAQAAAWDQSRKQKKEDPAAVSIPGPSRLSQRLHKLIVAVGAVLILVGCIRIATRLFDDGGAGSALPQAQSEQTPPAASASPAAIPPVPSSPDALPLPKPNPPPATSPSGASTPNAAKPGQQSLLPESSSEFALGTATPQTADQAPAPSLPSWATPDITGTLPHAQAAPSVVSAPDRPAAVADDTLPTTIGNPALRKAALAGDPAAEYEVATRFAEGRGVLQNNQEAIYWLQRAATQGLAPAQFRLGALYEKGIGVRKDLATARDLYLAAAQKGNGKAMHNLAVLYAEGGSGTPDYNKAADWFRQAANHGIRDSQYNLGILYARGIGVDRNNAESYKWFAIAAAQGDADAAKKRDEIAAQLDSQSLAAARLAAQNWKPEPQPEEAINVKASADWGAPAKDSRTAKAP